MLRFLVVLSSMLMFVACGGPEAEPTNPATSSSPPPLGAEAAGGSGGAPATAPGTASTKRQPVPYNASAPDNHLRPNYHFTPPAGWMNDPNGMLYHAGEYHLFYQHYPDDNVWGPMHWGHAVSTDLVNWEHLPIALYPDSLGYIFSGSAVVDHGNTSGFGTGTEPPLVAMYTYHDMAAEKAGRDDFQSQAIAYSNDRGRTWTKYAGNPVIPNRGVRDFRDPKVVRDVAHDQWVMVLAAQDRVQFFGSKDLKDWTYLSEFGQETTNHAGVWECPELIPYKNSEGGDLWALLVSINPGGANGGSGTMYFTGTWNGNRFFPLCEPVDSTTDTVKWIDYGRDDYAGVSFDNAPDNRRIFMGWMSNWDYAQTVPTTSWRSTMTIPRELRLEETDDFGCRLRQQPVEELKQLRDEKISLEMPRLLDGATTIDLSQLKTNGAYELELEIDLVDSDAEELYVTLSTADGDNFYRFGYSRKPGVDNAFFTDRRSSGKTDFDEEFAPEGLTIAPRWSNEGTLRFHVYFDRTSAEVFCDQGEPVMTDIFFPDKPFTMLAFETYGSAGEGMAEGWSLVKGNIWGLK